MSVSQGFLMKGTVGSPGSARVHCNSLLELSRVVPTDQACVCQFPVRVFARTPLLAVALIPLPAWAWGHWSSQPLEQMIQSVHVLESSNSVPELGMCMEVS